MNGVAKVTIKGREYPLKFGVQALLLYEVRTSKQEVSENPIENVMNASMNVFYSGLAGACIRLEKPVMSFADAVDLYDEWYLEKDYEKQMLAVWDSFNASVLPIIKARNPEAESKKKAKNT